jgi:hypothetical protein
MSAPTTCICTLSVRDVLGALFTGTAELVCEPRKSFVQSSSANLVLSRPVRTTAVAGVCTLTLVETTTANQLVTFTLNWNDSDKNFGTIVFDPIAIPNSSSVDLSTILSVGRG